MKNISTTFDIGDTVFAIKHKYIDTDDWYEDQEQIFISEGTITDIVIYINKENIYTEYLIDNDSQHFMEGSAEHIRINTLYKTYEDALEALQCYNRLYY